MDDYKALIAREVQKLEALRDTRKEVDEKIAESEQFIKLLTARSSQGGDDLGALVERKMASKSAKATPAAESAAAKPVEQTEQRAPMTIEAKYQYPKIRSDSAWPYILVMMSRKPGAWKALDIVQAVLAAKLLKTDSAVRSTLSQMSAWGLLANDTPGYFAVAGKGATFVAGRKPNQFEIGADLA
jgi:phage-related tail fiber protein